MYKKRKWFLAQIRGHSAAANGHQSSSGQVRGRSKEPRLGGDPHFSQELHLGELRAIVSYVYIASLSQRNIMPSSSYRYIYTPQTKTWSRGSMQATQAVLDSTHKQCSTQLPSSARHSRQNGHGRRRLPCKAASQPIFGQHITYTYIYICREIPMRPPFG